MHSCKSERAERRLERTKHQQDNRSSCAVRCPRRNDMQTPQEERTTEGAATTTQKPPSINKSCKRRRHKVKCVGKGHDQTWTCQKCEQPAERGEHANKTKKQRANTRSHALRSASKTMNEEIRELAHGGDAHEQSESIAGEPPGLHKI